MAEQQVSRRQLFVALALLVLLIGASGIIVWNNFERAERWRKPVSGQEPFLTHPYEGSVRVGVLSPPTIGDGGQGGATLRSLVLPRLFVAYPDGTWRASLVEQGSDRTADDARSAHFRLRKGAVWSDGTEITVHDLERSVDNRFVDRIEGPGNDRTIKVIFKRPFPGWRMLWSGDTAIPAPKDGISGGPFKIKSITPGLETVLEANRTWYEMDSPFLDEIKLIQVMDSTMARQLLAAGQIDVISVPAETNRIKLLQRLKGVTVRVEKRGGAWMGLKLNDSTQAESTRRTIADLFPRDKFRESLLDGEVASLTGLVDEDDRSLVPHHIDKPALGGARVSFASVTATPMQPLVERSMQVAVANAGGTQVSGEGDVALTSFNEDPTTCWQCLWLEVDPDRAVQADMGDIQAAYALERRLRDEQRAIPLWREYTVIASRDALVSGARPNGYTRSVAWDAQRWWRQ